MNVRIFDCDGDSIVANDAEEWSSLDDCIEDIDIEFDDAKDASYLPWTIVEYDLELDAKDMTVLANVPITRLKVIISKKTTAQNPDAVCTWDSDGKAVPFN